MTCCSKPKWFNEAAGVHKAVVNTVTLKLKHLKWWWQAQEWFQALGSSQVLLWWLHTKKDSISRLAQLASICVAFSCQRVYLMPLPPDVADLKGPMAHVGKHILPHSLAQSSAHLLKWWWAFSCLAVLGLSQVWLRCLRAHSRETLLKSYHVRSTTLYMKDTKLAARLHKLKQFVT